MKKLSKAKATLIAKEELFIDTLEVRGRDGLDFHDVSVTGIKKALQRAFEEGQKST